MPESPDFEKIAALVLDPLVLAVDRQHAELPPGQYGAVKQSIAEQLRQVWNARGAADLEQVDTTLSTLMGHAASGPYVQHLERALRTLDRTLETRRAR